MKEEDRKLWIDKIDSYRSSGLAAAKWAENHGISVHRLRYYINKFNKEKKQTLTQESKMIKWASIVQETPKVERPANPLRIVIGKANIEIDSPFDEDILESIVKVLSRC